MTSLRRLLNSESYRSAILAALSFGAENGEEVRRSLSDDVPVPEGVSGEQWIKAIEALRLAFEVGSREGYSDVRDDLSLIAGSLSDVELQFLDSLLNPTSAFVSRAEGLRKRDLFLPNLARAVVGIDLHMLDHVAAGEPAQVAPVITARFEFDEHIAGQDALSFRIPMAALNDLSQQFELLSRRLEELSSGPIQAVVPEWAMPASDEGENRDSRGV